MLEAIVPARTTLDRGRIVEAALELLEQVGLEGLSTRRLAGELGVKGPSLYWHFKNKEELLAHMSSVLFLKSLPSPDFDSADFDVIDWLQRGARGVRAAAFAHRDGAVLMARAVPMLEDDRRAFDEMTRCMHERSGLSWRDSSLTLLTLGRFVTGWSLYEHTVRPDDTRTDWEKGFEFGLDTFLKGIRARINALPKPPG